MLIALLILNLALLVVLIWQFSVFASRIVTLQSVGIETQKRAIALLEKTLS